MRWGAALNTNSMLNTYSLIRSFVPEEHFFLYHRTSLPTSTYALCLSTTQYTLVLGDKLPLNIGIFIPCIYNSYEYADASEFRYVFGNKTHSSSSYVCIFGVAWFLYLISYAPTYTDFQISRTSRFFRTRSFVKYYIRPKERQTRKKKLEKSFLRLCRYTQYR